MRTPKNNMVSGHYESLGFALAAGAGEHLRVDFLALDDYQAKNKHIKQTEASQKVG